jgi:hypothetical protein
MFDESVISYIADISIFVSKVFSFRFILLHSGSWNYMDTDVSEKHAASVCFYRGFYYTVGI